MNKFKYIGLLAVGCLWGCQSSDIMLYEQNAAVYFESSTYGYTFLEDPAIDSKVVKLPVDISGSQVNYDREFIVARLATDTLTTAEENQYVIGRGIVEANKYSGYVEVEIFKDGRLNDSVYQIALEILPNKDFPEVRLNQKTILLSFTNKVIQPANWKWLRYYFGVPFSTRLWTFVCEATGRTSFPYDGKNGLLDPETWWMSIGEIKAYSTIVRLALDKYNADPRNNPPLLHDDGEYAKTPIVIPIPT